MCIRYCKLTLTDPVDDTPVECPSNLFPFSPYGNPPLISFEPILLRVFSIPRDQHMFVLSRRAFASSIHTLTGRLANLAAFRSTLHFHLLIDESDFRSQPQPIPDCSYHTQEVKMYASRMGSAKPSVAGFHFL